MPPRLQRAAADAERVRNNIQIVQTRQPDDHDGDGPRRAHRRSAAGLTCLRAAEVYGDPRGHWEGTLVGTTNFSEESTGASENELIERFTRTDAETLTSIRSMIRQRGRGRDGQDSAYAPGRNIYEYIPRRKPRDGGHAQGRCVESAKRPARRDRNERRGSIGSPEPRRRAATDRAAVKALGVRHDDLRQRLRVHDVVFMITPFRKKERRQRVDLVGPGVCSFPTASRG